MALDRPAGPETRIPGHRAACAWLQSVHLPVRALISFALPSITALDLDRYLVAFDSRHVPSYRFDVLVVGSGAAGSITALTAADRGASVAIIAKGSLSESNTLRAQGGMAAVVSPEDQFASHIADTMRVGCGMCHRDIVEAVVHGGPAAVRQLIDLGAEFDQGSNGGFDLSREGGHTHPRVIHAQGDATGREIQRVVTGGIDRHDGVAKFDHLFAIDLLSADDGRVCGVLCKTERGDLVAFQCSQVVLATGGGGQIYRETTNPAIATADGVAMGIRAGAAARDLEFVQFHPTCLYIAGAARVLISEIVRGAGAVLRDRHGVRFMPKYHPQAELAPRDVVSRAVFERMVSTNDTSVYLDLSAIDGDPHLSFPGISHICRFFGIDIARDPVPVRPGAHYMVGGLEVDADGKCSIPGLWAAGECASSGLHGANRMGSNSLLQAVVVGNHIGEVIGDSIGNISSFVQPAFERRRSADVPIHAELSIEDLVYSLKSLMWRQMGVERDAPGIRDASDKLEFWMRTVQAIGSEEKRNLELANMLLVARMAAISALAREESRGVHYRTDFPDAKPEWQAHTSLRPSLSPDRLDSVELHRVPIVEAVTQP
ncbi:MAG: L-aspartate oxidase [Planctomycetota bacterium]